MPVGKYYTTFEREKERERKRKKIVCLRIHLYDCSIEIFIDKKNWFSRAKILFI